MPSATSDSGPTPSRDQPPRQSPNPRGELGIGHRLVTATPDGLTLRVFCRGCREQRRQGLLRGEWMDAWRSTAQHVLALGRLEQFDFPDRATGHRPTIAVENPNRAAAHNPIHRDSVEQVRRERNEPVDPDGRPSIS